MQVLNPLLQGWDYPVVLIADTDKFSHSRLPFPYWSFFLHLLSHWTSLNLGIKASKKYQKFWMIGKNLHHNMDIKMVNIKLPLAYQVRSDSCSNLMYGWDFNSPEVKMLKKIFQKISTYENLAYKLIARLCCTRWLHSIKC